MERDELKSIWKGMSSEHKDHETIRSMTQERNHPVLKSIRRQMIIEILAFSIFLLLYYDFFDGDRAPLYVNVLLITALLLAILHNIMGYRLAKHPVKGDNLQQSLKDHLSRMKGFAAISIASRALYAGSLLLFFTSAISFTAGKYWAVAGIVLIVTIQLFLLSGIWKKRIRRIKKTTDSFCSDALS